MLNLLDLRQQVISDYKNYVTSFANISDERIAAKANALLDQGQLWPDPLLQCNPGFVQGDTVGQLIEEGVLPAEMGHIFTGFALHQHQSEAIRLGAKGKSFIVTSGTGSGKSLTFLGTIFQHVLRQLEQEEASAVKGVQAIVVYPMNALINSQLEEIKKYEQNYLQATEGRPFPITYAQYTGQESPAQKQSINDHPPHLLLTNYMMLELLLTRSKEDQLRQAIFQNLRFLVFDELHTYRGRQGADVALLIRRMKAQTRHELQILGTSATLSSGKLSEQKQAVIQLGKQLFDLKMQPEQIVQETLEAVIVEPSPNADTLAEALQHALPPDLPREALLQHPLANWMEKEVALEENDEQLVRRSPQTLTDIRNQLARFTKLPTQLVDARLSEFLQVLQHINTGVKVGFLPFRVHQFISQTQSLKVTLEAPDTRTITQADRLPIGPDGKQRLLYPVVFNQQSGFPYLSVTLEEDRVKPRRIDLNLEEAPTATEDTGLRGYLLYPETGSEELWINTIAEELLPDNWLRTQKGQRLPKKDKLHRLPQKCYVNASGAYSKRPQKGFSEVWFLAAPLAIDPISGTLYDGATRDFNKLMQLGNAGRGIATTVLTFNTLQQLAASGAPKSLRKFMSFTDNRQDAALQAGHFNDFLQQVFIRAGIYKALQQREGLQCSEIAIEVFKALQLEEKDYALIPDWKPKPEPDATPTENTDSAKRGKNEAVFKSWLFHRIVQDLRRSWRHRMPNLEQCGLIRIEYLDLKRQVQQQENWQTSVLLRHLSASDRYDFMVQFLNFFRFNAALSHPKLHKNSLEIDQNRMLEKLKPTWLYQEKEKLRESTWLSISPQRSKGKNSAHIKSIGPASAAGKYLRMVAKEIGLELDRKQLTEELQTILDLLSKRLPSDISPPPQAPRTKESSKRSTPAHGAYSETPPTEATGANPQVAPESEEAPPETTSVPPVRLGYLVAKPQKNHTLYQLDLTTLEWTLNPDGKPVPDRIYTRSFKTPDIPPNPFFLQLYQMPLKALKGLEAKEHTGQTPAGERQTIEANFRKAEVKALYCSPTMELGIDIDDLSVVHMRNVPPTPANYVQRSGRAGRKGQGALIFTFCSQSSAHDQHYFKKQAEMVAGHVAPQQLDLLNEELLRSQLHALYLSFCQISGLSKSIDTLLEIEHSDLPLKEGFNHLLKLPVEEQEKVAEHFSKIIYSLQPGLMKKTWYTSTWIQDQIQAVPERFDAALDRWRKMYLEAAQLKKQAASTIASATITQKDPAYAEAISNQASAQRKLDLLRNEASQKDVSEFYPFRYLAAEGFLPGYNFHRLPIRAFLAKNPSGGHFISRPRTMAIREFGPQTLIYQGGLKYKVHRMALPTAESGLALTQGKLINASGFLAFGSDARLDLDPFTQTDLSNPDNYQDLNQLIELQEVQANQQDRISCGEDERMKRGFLQHLYFSYSGNWNQVKRQDLYLKDGPLLHFRYLPAADLILVNKGWRSSKSEGYHLNVQSGIWLSRNQYETAPQEEQDQSKLVYLYTSTTADCLYIDLDPGLQLDTTASLTLMQAMKKAFELYFQVEPQEIGCALVGNLEHPKILFFESAEGSLGLLSQVGEQPSLFQEIAAIANRICHFEDGKDLHPEGIHLKASYEDLLSYYNQPYHDWLDRHTIRQALALILQATTSPNIH